MMTQVPGRIYLADQRGLTTDQRFQRYSTFNFGAYQAEHKEPLDRLSGLNEESLAGGQHSALPVAQASQVLLIPVTGAVESRVTGGEPTLVHVEEIQLLNLPAGSTLTLRNPYEDELISFLHLWLVAELPTDTAVSTDIFAFDVEALENRLGELVSSAPATPAGPGRAFILSLGRFAGRQESIYKVQSRESLFFAFVLTGAFELEGRLLHAKDGLALWEADELELEALSNDALVVVLEVLAGTL